MCSLSSPENAFALLDDVKLWYALLKAYVLVAVPWPVSQWAEAPSGHLDLQSAPKQPPVLSLTRQ